MCNCCAYHNVILVRNVFRGGMNQEDGLLLNTFT